MSSPDWFKWGWYFTLSVESGVQYPSTDIKWNRVESDYLLPNDRLYGGGVGIIQFTSENFEVLERIVRNGYNMDDFPDGVIKSDLVNNIKTINWFKSSASPEGGLFNVDETIAIKEMLESDEGIKSQAFFNDKYFNKNNRSQMNAIKNSNLDDECKAFLVNIIVLRPASVIPLINTNPSNIDQLVINTLAIPQLSGYGTRMHAVADGLKSINISDEPPIDIDKIIDGQPPETEPDKPDLSPVDDFFDDFSGNVITLINSLLNKNVFYFGNEKTIGNNTVKMTKLMNNMYRIQLTDIFKGILSTAISEGKVNLDDVLDNLTPNPPEKPTEPPEEPTTEKYFPVDYTRQGVNFWSPPYSDTLTNNMDYGTRTSGVWHNGYDIGGGGINHKIYAVRSGEVTKVGIIGGYGTTIQIKHNDDEYYSFYAHLVSNSALVSVGDTVEAGEEIATMGNTGGNYAIHLHIEISKTDVVGNKDNTINPREYLEVIDNNKTNLSNPS